MEVRYGLAMQTTTGTGTGHRTGCGAHDKVEFRDKTVTWGELGQTGLAQPKTKDIVWHIRRQLTNHTAQKGTGRLAKLVLGGQNGLPYETKDASRGERPSNLVEIAPIDHHQSIISTYWPTHAMDFRGPSTYQSISRPPLH